MTWIDNDNDFATWCREAQQHDALAVDTEFVWTKTCYPQLGLLQMAWDREHCALVDVLAITDTTPFREILENDHIVKIFHEAASDLPILRRWTKGEPAKNIFDTRIAAGFVGLTASLSLNKLLTEILGITLPKTETRTNWLQRPLTDKQLEYASGDVIFMPDLYRKLHDKLTNNSNLDWFLEEMKLVESEDYYEETDPNMCWKRVSYASGLPGRNLAVVKELAAWRETFARTSNLARPRIISDEQIVACATQLPKNKAELVTKAGMWTKNADRYSEPILEAIQRGLNTSKEDYPRHHFVDMDSKLIRSRAERIKKLIVKRSTAREIDSVLVGARKDMESFVIAAQTKSWPFQHRLLEGWRRNLLGDAIEWLGANNFKDA